MVFISGKGGPRLNAEVANCWRCGILFSVAGYGRADAQTGSFKQLVFDILCSSCSGGLELVVTDEDGLGGVGSTVMDDILAVSVFIGCGKEDGRILTAMQSFLLK